MDTDERLAPQAQDAVDRLRTIEEASERLRTPVNTLRYWRQIGAGPKSFRLGRRVFYTDADLDAWVRECRGAATV